MVMAGLPVLKLAGLLVKTISKPFTSRLKVEAQKRERVGNFVASVGQSIHYVTTRINVFATGYKFIGVKPLPRDDALSEGVTFLSESFLLIIAGSIIIIEYRRGEIKNVEKAQKVLEKELREKKILENRLSAIEDYIQDIHLSLPANSKDLVSLRQEARINGLELPTSYPVNDKKTISRWISW